MSWKYFCSKVYVYSNGLQQLNKKIKNTEKLNGNSERILYNLT